MTPDHHLFPPGRRFAAFVMARQRAHRTSAVIILERTTAPTALPWEQRRFFWVLRAPSSAVLESSFCLLQAATTAQRWSDTR